jgi:hypothetical protein
MQITDVIPATFAKSAIAEFVVPWPEHIHEEMK